MLFGTLGVDYVFELVFCFFFPSDIYTGVELLGHMVVLFLVFFFLISILFLTGLHLFTFLPTVLRRFPFLRSQYLQINQCDTSL